MSRQEMVRHMDSRDLGGVTTSPTYSHSSSMSPPRVTYHMWRRPLAVISSTRVVLRAILEKCRWNGRLGLLLGFDMLWCVCDLGCWMSVRIVVLYRRTLSFVGFGSSLLIVEDDCCSVQKKRFTSLLGLWILFKDYCEPCFFVFFKGGIENDLILCPSAIVDRQQRGINLLCQAGMNNG